MTEIYIDADACPVREEVYRVAERFNLVVHVVSNGSRPIRPEADPRIHMVVVEAGADIADDWIAERITDADVCITSDIPLASRCLAKGARAVASNGRVWTGDNIGSALAGREIGYAMREAGHITRGPAPMQKSDRSKFLEALDTAIRAAMKPKVTWRVVPPG
jgi:uncharacterized protein YaiI (UPF0178 family)